MKCKYWYWGIWLQDIEELPLKMCIVRNLLLKQCTLEELNHGDLPLYFVIHTRICHMIWRIWNAWWNMVTYVVQHAFQILHILCQMRVWITRYRGRSSWFNSSSVHGFKSKFLTMHIFRGSSSISCNQIPQYQYLHFICLSPLKT